MYGIESYLHLDRNGKPAERSKTDYPYTYSAFVTHRNGKNSEITGSMYSDRMMQRDWDKFHNSVEKVFGDRRQMFHGATFEQLQQLVRHYVGDDKLRLILVEEMCNVSNGYPLWLFSYAQTD